MDGYILDYFRIYEELIEDALLNPKEGYKELHHIMPRSMGGKDENGNLVFLTVRQHYIAHLLLTKLDPNQWFSVEAILNDTNNKNRIHRYKTPKLKYKNWIRRNIAKQKNKNFRKYVTKTFIFRR